MSKRCNIKPAHLLIASRLLAKCLRALVLVVVAALVAFAGTPGDARWGQNPDDEISKIREQQAREEIASLKKRGVRDDDAAMVPLLRKLSQALGGQLDWNRQDLILERIIVLDQIYPQASTCFEKATCLMELGDHKQTSSPVEARKLYERAIPLAMQISTKSRESKLEIELRCRLASMDFKRKDFRSAAAQYRSVDTVSGGMENVKEFPDELLESYGNVLVELKEYREATRVFRRLVALDSTRPKKYDDRELTDLVSLARCLLAQGQRGEVQRLSGIVIEKAGKDAKRGWIPSDSKRALLDLGELLEKDNQLDRAEQVYRLILVSEL